jgi:hypothetical protein
MRMWRDFHPSKASIVLGKNEPTAKAHQRALQPTNITRSTITSVPLADFATAVVLGNIELDSELNRGCDARPSPAPPYPHFLPISLLLDQ